MIISVEWATDPAFTQNVSGGNQTCPATNVICWTSFRPNHIWKGRYYWKVKIAGADEPAESATWMFSAQVRDNKGEVRMRALLTYRGLPVLEGRTPFAPVAWRVKQRFYSIRPLARRLPAGVYKICITAWDRAGNQGRNCAPATASASSPFALNLRGAHRRGAALRRPA